VTTSEEIRSRPFLVEERPQLPVVVTDADVLWGNVLATAEKTGILYRGTSSSSSAVEDQPAYDGDGFVQSVIGPQIRIRRRDVEDFHTFALALRGFVGNDVLVHVLADMRLKKHFGPRGGGGKITRPEDRGDVVGAGGSPPGRATTAATTNSNPTELAVPYTAANLASTNSEFAHPDVQLALTLLMYYEEGISFSQFSRVLKFLIRKLQSKAKVHEDEHVRDAAKNFFRSQEQDVAERDQEEVKNLLDFDGG
ncbi:unnamed protein product, partial [Amoebophrya sp. A120]